MDNFGRLISEIRAELPRLELRENEQMRDHCSFKIGGAARVMALPSSAEEAEKLCLSLRRSGVEPLIVGNGTNLLVTDSPLDRFVVKFSDKMGSVEKRGDNGVFALSGISLARLASFCAKASLTGLEFAHGIPGTLGGAVSMNAGAYGGEMKDVLRSADYLDENLKLCRKTSKELEMGYRHSVFSETGCVILGAEIELASGSEDAILTRMRELSEKRRASQPLDMPSAGSTFKRPEQGYAAALIDEAGLKGFAIGGAEVSKKHAGFVINRGNATFDEVLALIEHIQKTVYERTGISLEPEVKIIHG